VLRTFLFSLDSKFYVRRTIMETKAYTVSLEKSPLISVKVIPGHFATDNAHINNYLDLSTLKSSAKVARAVARQLAIPYLTHTPVDTIVCMEKTKVIGAYLADELTQEGLAVINAGREIYVVAPVNNVSGNMVFQDSVVEWISNKNVLLLAASVSTGQALRAGMECIAYYGGKLAGISSLFVASPDMHKVKIHSLFSSEDIPGYKMYGVSECDMCKAGQKIDAMISSDGYTKME